MLDLKIYEEKMEKAIDVLKREFSGLRTGRASTSLLDPISVEAYGSKVPLNQVSNISVPESRLLIVQVWDDSLVNTVENSIRNSNLGLNPMIEGSLIKIRNIRRDAMEKIKSLEKNKEISQDESFKFSDEVQNMTKILIEKIDTLFADKEKDILRV